MGIRTTAPNLGKVVLVHATQGICPKVISSPVS